MANDFMYGVPPRHTHGENRVNRNIHMAKNEKDAEIERETHTF